MHDPRLAMRAAAAAFFLSGAASLGCEVIWFKLFGLVLGNGTLSASAVVAVFFVGLGLGSILSGRLADRWERPLRAYGYLELALAAVSLVTSFALIEWQSWIGLFRPWMGLESAAAMPLKVAIASALLVPPTMLMGATLPVLSRYLVRQRDQVSSRVGLLYGVNTFGAAVGTFTVGFFWIGAIGVSATAVLASAVYALIGISAVLLARDEAPVEVVEEPTPEGSEPRDAPVLIAVFAMSGFASVGYEILWFRLLTYFSIHTVYAFAGLLTVYLLGLVVGAGIAARVLAPHRDRHLLWFARLQLGIALSGLVTLALLGRMSSLLAVAEISLVSLSGMALLLVLVAVILGPPAILIGITFPLASEITVERLSGLGSRLGLVYGLNTVCGSLGSLAMGFLLLPLVGSQIAAMVLAGMNLLLFAVIVWRHAEVRRAPGIGREAALTAVAVVGAYVWMGPSYLRDAQTNVIGATVLDFQETADGTFLTIEYDEGGTKYQQVVVSGASYANNRPPGRRYMALLAHLPMLLSDHPDQTLVICVGTGTTVGAASIHDRATTVWAVDLSAEIFRVAPYFQPWNHAFFENDRVKEVVADGRHFLTVTDEQFDVLTFEPPPPIEAGVANLYSREFYELARERMREDGLVVQWIPFHQGFRELQKQLIQSMMVTYPHVSLWVADRREGILIGSERPLAISVDALRSRMREPDVKQDLSKVGINSPEDLLATFVAADDDLRAWVGDVPPVTDDRPSVERFLFHDTSQVTMVELLEHRGRIEDHLLGRYDQAALDHSRAWTDHLWTAVDAFLDGQPREASELLEPALDLEPDNAYLRYREWEFRTTVEADEARSAP